jgi:hypothetical protein
MNPSKLPGDRKGTVVENRAQQFNHLRNPFVSIRYFCATLVIIEFYQFGDIFGITWRRAHSCGGVTVSATLKPATKPGTTSNASVILVILTPTLRT